MEAWLGKIQEHFQYELRPFQEETLSKLWDKDDVFLSVCTGGGKSLCYQAFGVVETEAEPGSHRIVVVFTPLKSIMQEQAAGEVDDVFCWLSEDLKKFSDMCPRTLIFCKTIKDCSLVFGYLKRTINITTHFDMFHSCTTDEKKEYIRNDMAKPDGRVRCLIATNAAGMGVNYCGVTRVINYGPPQELDSLLQHIGRAGRDGSSATHTLLYTGKQLRNCQPEVLGYVKTDVCLRRSLLLPYNSSPTIEPSHDCCEFCAADCKCEDGCKSLVPSPVLLMPTVEEEQPEWRDATPTNRYNVTHALQALRAQSSQSYLPAAMSSGLTEDVIACIIERLAVITSADDIMSKCPIVSYELALHVFEVFKLEFSDSDCDILDSSNDSYLSDDD